MKLKVYLSFVSLLACMPAFAAPTLTINGALARCQYEPDVKSWNWGYAFSGPSVTILNDVLNLSLWAQYYSCQDNNGQAGWVATKPPAGATLVVWRYFLFSTGKFSSPLLDSNPSATTIQIPLKSLLYDSELQAFHSGQTVGLTLALYNGNSSAPNLDESRSAGYYILTMEMNQAGTTAKISVQAQ